MQIINDTTVVVNDNDELKSVLSENNTYNYIYLGDNIEANSGFIINSNKSKVIIDGTYNASVDSMKSSIDVLANYKKRKVAILADMLELGDYSQQLHEEVGNYVATKEIDVLICIGKEAKYMYQKAKEKMKNVYYFTSNQEVIEQLDQFLKNDDVVLVKGSHSMNLKEIVEKI